MPIFHPCIGIQTSYNGFPNAASLPLNCLPKLTQTCCQDHPTRLVSVCVFSLYGITPWEGEIWGIQIAGVSMILSTATMHQGLLTFITFASLSYTIPSSFVSSNERVEPLFGILGQLVTRRIAKK